MHIKAGIHIEVDNVEFLYAIVLGLADDFGNPDWNDLRKKQLAHTDAQLPQAKAACPTPGSPLLSKLMQIQVTTHFLINFQKKRK